MADSTPRACPTFVPNKLLEGLQIFLILKLLNECTIPQLSWGMVRYPKTKRIPGGNTKQDRREIWIQSNDGTESLRGRHFGVRLKPNSNFTPCASTFRIPRVSTAVANRPNPVSHSRHLLSLLLCPKSKI